MPVLKDNRVLLAAAGGALAGAAIATLIGSRKGQQVLTQAAESVKDRASKRGSQSAGPKPTKENAVQPN